MNMGIGMFKGRNIETGDKGVYIFLTIDGHQFPLSLDEAKQLNEKLTEIVKKGEMFMCEGNE